MSYIAHKETGFP